MSSKGMIAGIIVVLMGAVPSVGNTIYVDAAVSGGDGTSWATAFHDLQDALAIAAAGDEIRVAQGIYRPDRGTGDRTATFRLISGVSILGGYAGVVMPDNRDARDVGLYPTLLSGDLNGDDGPLLLEDFAACVTGAGVPVAPGCEAFDLDGDNDVDIGDALDGDLPPFLFHNNYGENSYHVLTGSGTDTTTVLDGVVISGANADGECPYDQGGGMYNIGGSPTLRDCTFVGNSARGGAGMANVSESHPALIDCQFTGNTTDTWVGGSGMFNFGSSPTLTGCSFTNNATRFEGGAVFNLTNSNPELTDCEFVGNIVAGPGWGLGGAMANVNGSNPTFVDCRFTNNTANDRDGGAIGITNASGSTLTRCEFTGNAGRGGGAILCRQAGDLHLTDCTFTANQATSSHSGAIWVDRGNHVFIRCTFTSNTAAYQGGGMRMYDCDSILTDCTFVGNTAGQAGGGLESQLTGGVLTRCVFGGNNAGSSGGGMRITNQDASNPWSAVTPTLIDCNFIGNLASYGGGGLASYRANVMNVSSCVFASNSASAVGGGLYNNESKITLTNCTCAGNWAPDGRAVHCKVGWGFYSDLQIRNCILWDSGDEIANPGGWSTISITHSDVQGGYTGAGNINADPLFADLIGGDYHLQAGSPCVNTGNNLAPYLPVLDFDGETRIQECRVDMGADESPHYVDCNGNSVADACEIALRLSYDCDRDGIPDDCQGGGDPCGSNQAPVPVCRNVTVSADNDCQAEVPPNDIGGLSYDPEGDQMWLEVNPAGPYPLGDTAVTVTVTDVLGESASCPATITVVDDTPPKIVCPADVSIPADTIPDPAETGQASATDNCDAAPTITYSDSVLDRCCEEGSLITRTWTATDAAGNASVCFQRITAGDVTPPVLDGVPEDKTVECDAVPAPAEPTATDNCDPNPIITFDEVRTDGACPNSYTLTRTWTTTDTSGNTGSESQLITVQDTTAPVLSDVPIDVTVECDAIPAPANPTATDNCDPSPVITLDEVRTDGACANNYILTRTWTATDACGNNSSQSQIITVQDTTAPVLSGVPADVIVECDAVPNPAAPTATDNCDLSPAITYSEIRIDGASPNDYTLVRTWTATDACGNATVQEQIITVEDTTPPEIRCPGSITGEPGVPVFFTVTAIDNCDPVPDIECVDEDGFVVVPGDTFPIGNTTVTCTATDDSGNTAACTFVVTITETVPLTITSLEGDPLVVGVGTPVALVATFTDNLGDTHTADWYYGDGTSDQDVPVDGEPTESEPGSDSTSHTYTDPGVYTVTLTIADNAGNTATDSIFVVVYDPSGGFVTGGGWIDSPLGAYAADQLLTGRANFGFVSKYKKGATAPTGQTEFQFKVADLNFHSTSYQWLVVAGPRAQYKGSGAINQQGDYGFMLTAIDGAIPGGGGVDKFRIKIWDKSMNDQIVYDNQMDAGDDEAPTTAISGGNIVIHDAK